MSDDPKQAEKLLSELVQDPRVKSGALKTAARREILEVHTGAVDDAHLHRPVVVQAGVEELHPKRRPVVVPERAFGTEADVAPLIVGDLEEPVGHLTLGIPVGFLGEFPRAAGDFVEVEGRDRGRGEPRDAEDEQRRQTEVARRPTPSGSRPRPHQRLPGRPAGTIRLLSSTTQGCGLVSQRPGDRSSARSPGPAGLPASFTARRRRTQPP